MALCTRGVPARGIARNIGASRAVLYKWKDEIIGDVAYQNMRKHKKPSLTVRAGRTAGRSRAAKSGNSPSVDGARYPEKGSRNNKKKIPGISVSPLTNREKTLIGDALRNEYPLAVLLRTLQLAHSSYFYYRAALRAGDKYTDVRTVMSGIFNGNYRYYGYRRLHAMLRHEGLSLSDKVGAG